MKPNFFDRFTSGLLLGSLAALLLASRIDSRVTDRIAENWVQFATIFAAICAALIALIGVQRQIEHGRKIEEARRAASLRAAKSTLPLALSEICNIALSKIQDCVDTSTFDPDLLVKAPEHIGEPTIKILKECIEFSDIETGEQLASIIRIYQVRNAWENGKLGKIVEKPTPQTLDGYNRMYHAIDWAVIYALCDQAFPFSRDEHSRIEGTLDPVRIKSALNFANVYPDNYTDFSGILDKFIDRKGYENRYTKPSEMRD